jgi:hypothetical protein
VAEPAIHLQIDEAGGDDRCVQGRCLHAAELLARQDARDPPGLDHHDARDQPRVGQDIACDNQRR